MSADPIEIRDNRRGQPRAYIAGTRVRVQDIYVMSEQQGLSADEIVRSLPHLTLAQVHSALAHYFAHRDQILQEIREDLAFVDQMKSQAQPSLLCEKLKSLDAGHDPLANWSAFFACCTTAWPKTR